MQGRLFHGGGGSQIGKSNHLSRILSGKDKAEAAEEYVIGAVD